jgi:hypothetical protein
LEVSHHKSGFNRPTTNPSIQISVFRSTAEDDCNENLGGFFYAFKFNVIAFEIMENTVKIAVIAFRHGGQAAMTNNSNAQQPPGLITL